MRLAQTIYTLRTQKGMSQGDLADALEVSRQSVSKWETGGATPDLDKLVKMSALFGVTLDELVTGQQGEAAAQPEETLPPLPPAAADQGKNDNICQQLWIESENTV